MKSKVYIVLTITIGLLSCSDILEVPDISNQQVNLIAPANQVTLEPGNISFTWEQVEDAETYHLQIAIPSFIQAQQILSDTIVEASNFSIILSEGSYQWRVRGENSAYQTPYNTNSFTVE